jgi:hypothetical protein
MVLEKIYGLLVPHDSHFSCGCAWLAYVERMAGNDVRTPPGHVAHGVAGTTEPLPSETARSMMERDAEEADIDIV